MSKTVYQTDFDGYYVGPTLADESPLEPGVYLIPGGAIEQVPPSLSNGQRARWVNGAWTVEIAPPPPEPPVPTPAEVRQQILDGITAERNRRMRSVVWFEGKPYDVDDASLQRITGAATLAGFAMGAGAQAGDLQWHGGDDPFGWIAADNTVTLMDAQTMFAFGQAAANNESRHIFTARAMKDMDPLPADYADDAYWPMAAPVTPEDI